MNRYKLKNTRYNWVIHAKNEGEATKIFLEQSQKEIDEDRGNKKKLSLQDDKIFANSFIRGLYKAGRKYPNEPGYNEAYDDFYDDKNNEMKLQWELVE
jgi:hypothetical protein